MDNQKAIKRNPYIPDWKKGDSWMVEYKFQEPSDVASQPEPFIVKETWLYEIIEEDTVRFKIKISNKNFPAHYLLYMDKMSFTVLSFNEIEDANRVETKNNYQKNAYLRFNYNEKILFDFGSFLTITSDTCMMIPAPEEPTFMQEIVFDKEKPEMKLTLTGAFHGQKIISQQVWNKKSPWWTTAQKTIDNQVIVSGELIALQKK